MTAPVGPRWWIDFAVSYLAESGRRATGGLDSFSGLRGCLCITMYDNGSQNRPESDGSLVTED